MRDKIGLKVLAISVALVLVASSVAMYGHNAGEAEKRISEGGGKGVISLIAPPFIGVAGAAEVAGGGGGAFPEDEAGISAYVKTSRTINLEKLKKIFTEVEEVGDNYIIGITPISDFGGDIDVTVYADTSGWIVAYFKADEPAAKIMQWGTADVDNPVITTIATTTLRDAIYEAGAGAEVAIPPDIKYYDFEYPDANSMTIFIRTRATDGANIAQVEIPATYTLYEASYYHYIYSYAKYTGTGYQWDSKLKVDGTTISDAVPSSAPGYKWWRAFDSYRGHITTGMLHKIEISYEEPVDYIDDYGSAGVATVLIYKTA